jgi:hypothetical protein
VRVVGDSTLRFWLPSTYLCLSCLAAELLVLARTEFEPTGRAILYSYQVHQIQAAAKPPDGGHRLTGMKRDSQKRLWDHHGSALFPVVGIPESERLV